MLQARILKMIRLPYAFYVYKGWLYVNATQMQCITRGDLKYLKVSISKIKNIG